MLLPKKQAKELLISFSASNNSWQEENATHNLRVNLKQIYLLRVMLLKATLQDRTFAVFRSVAYTIPQGGMFTWYSL